MIFNREFATPSADTFSIPPICNFVERYVAASTCSVDPFARNSMLALWRNDIDPATSADHHMDAEEFLKMLIHRGTRVDLAIFDPPYSPRQISECYKRVGLKVSTEETQNARLYKRVRDALHLLLNPGGVALSFGWNSCGMGKTRGYDLQEILLVAHGGAHNDTICLAEQKK